MAGPDPAGPEFPDVERVTVTDAGTAPLSGSAKLTDAVALAVKVPADEELIVIVQVAVLPETAGVAQVSLSDPGAGLTDGVIAPKLGVVPLGTAVTVTVTGGGWPTSFTAEGLMAIDAST